MSKDRATRGPRSVQESIKQTKPFRSDGQEALLGLLLTADAVRWPIAELLAERAGDLTLPQYNVLRILRGAGKGGLPTLEIAERTIERTPGITRMLDRLERKGLVARERSDADRRQVICTLTDGGKRLLRALDAPMDALDDGLFTGLTGPELRKLIRLLDRVRDGLERRA